MIFSLFLVIVNVFFCVNGEVVDRNSYEKYDIDGELEAGAVRFSWCLDFREVVFRCFRKYLLLKFCSREFEVGRVEEKLRIFSLENGFLRFIF